ncbi:hypothetical protein D5S17_29310 [Pseudonocardiaceae bacterium YIM PH 21723]|nr:hypothetical protein D5S17_29310 [Pseudonocardiaceae bacterium YIM PH 21723]
MFKDALARREAEWRTPLHRFRPWLRRRLNRRLFVTVLVLGQLAALVNLGIHPDTTSMSPVIILLSLSILVAQPLSGAYSRQPHSTLDERELSLKSKYTGHSNGVVLTVLGVLFILSNLDRDPQIFDAVVRPAVVGLFLICGFLPTYLLMWNLPDEHGLEDEA